MKKTLGYRKVVEHGVFKLPVPQVYFYTVSNKSYSFGRLFEGLPIRECERSFCLCWAEALKVPSPQGTRNPAATTSLGFHLMFLKECSED